MAERCLPIKSWAEDDKPREKLLQKGVSALSTNELFAILLRSGSGDESAIDLSRRILADCDNNLNILARLNVRELINKYKGMGIAKASAIVATMEIGRRRRWETVDDLPAVTSSCDVFTYIYPFIGDLDHEEFWIIYLNHSNRVTGCEKHSSGGMDSTVIDIRMLFRKALDTKASYIVIAHNHPSGILSPSAYDKMITEKIKEAGNLVDIKLYDHVIVGNNDYFSFIDNDIF